MHVMRCNHTKEYDVVRAFRLNAFYLRDGQVQQPVLHSVRGE